MATGLLMPISGIIVAIACVVFVTLVKKSNHKEAFMNWPIVGMLPTLLLNVHRFHHWSTRVLSQNNHTIVFKGPWFVKMTIVTTCDPANFRHISTSNFSNFPKGPEFQEMFDVFGAGIINSDGEIWLPQRKKTQIFFSHSRFLRFMKKIIWENVENELIPLIEHFAEQGVRFDLQDVFQRFTFDTASVIITGTHPRCLSIEFPKVPFAEALDSALKTIFRRHYIPHSIWKLQRWLRIGREGKFMKEWMAAEEFIAQCISSKREKIMSKSKKDAEDDHDDQKGASADLLTIHMEEDDKVSDKYLRDYILNIVLGGKDTIATTLTWFFWLLSQNPSVEARIVQDLLEIKSNSSIPIKGKENMSIRKFDIEEVSGLVYLHAALFEALRLYPPVPFEHKNAANEDVLPSGHRVNANDTVLVSIYAMGRMEGIWGEDCLEYKPERWISPNGGIKYHPPYKFSTFNSGPRTCLGKGIAITLIKMVAATLLYNYHFEVIEGHPVSPKMSIILQMEHGLVVKIKRRVLW